MTEPPQPPNQPPPPSDYGHLPGPPQPSAYGFPPQGANPYAQQPGPQQPPQPQQFQHPQQPPTQPMYGYPPPPPGLPGMPTTVPGTPSKKKPAVLVAASVAALLLVGGVGYIAFAGADDDPKKPVAQGSPADGKPSASASVDNGDGSGNGSGEADLNSGRKQGEDKVLWLKTVKIDGPGMGVESPGQWVAGDTVVKGVRKSLTAYSAADGKEKWTLPFPALICATTPQTTTDGKTVVMYKDGESDTASCTWMRVVDLKTGKEVWSKEVPKEGLFDIFTSPSVDITGDTVAINRGGNASAFRISTGDKLFTGNQAEGCGADSYTSGNGKMIALATCRDENSTVEVQGVDPVTGAKGWTFRLPPKFKVTGIYSVDPVVLDLGNEESKERSIVVIGPDGKQTATLTGEGSFPVGCGDTGLFRSLTTCASSAVADNTLYLATKESGGKANEIVAFDLASGKAKWRTPAGDGRTITPLKAADGQLVFYRQAEEDKGGEILSIPAAGGTPTALLRNPSGPAAPIEHSFRLPDVDWVDGRFFISTGHLKAEGKEEKLLMVFGK
ncbi:PQQ-binding-like beta-propeller repeat protein [Streptomyces sp. NPDC059385]|uniref:outer membrane protein assembly factor BamB family protein n=1 Tax=Streptomyces sp. NPDC059385 TaxID=3346817 RepID=UPI0036B9096A